MALIPFDADLFGVTVALTLPYINLPGPMNLVFIDSKRAPIVIVNYPLMSLTVHSQDYNSIKKIVLIPGQGQVLGTEDVYLALTSPLGNPPLYGEIEHVNMIIPGLHPYAVKKERFRLIDSSRRPALKDIRTLKEGRECFTYPINDLLLFCQLLGLTPPPGSIRDEICTMILPRLQEIGHII